MNKNIKNVKFIEIDSSLKGAKEFIVTYDCNGKLVKEVFFVEEKAGLKNSDYLKLAKEKFKPNPKAIKGSLKTSPLSLKIIAACAGVAAITLGGLFTWKMLTNNPITPEPEPEPVVQEYTVKWVDEDGSLMDEEIYKEGELPAYKGEYHDKAGIFKDDGEEYMHFQEGWKEDINTPITEDTTFHAVYSDRLMVTTLTVEITQDDLSAYGGDIPLGFGFGGTVNHIDWDDGQSGEEDRQSPYHFYSQPGTYNIKIYGNVTNIFTDSWLGPELNPENTDGDSLCTNIVYGCSFDGKNYGGTFSPNGAYGTLPIKLKSMTLSSAIEEINDISGPYQEQPIEIKFDVNPRCRYITKFSEWISVENFVIPNSVLEIKEGAFANNYVGVFKSISFEPNSRCTYIGERSFYEQEGISEIRIPSSVKTLDSYAFQDCTNLEKIIFEEGSKLETIAEYAFMSTKIATIKIPASVTKIGPNIFNNCSSLKVIIFEESQQKVYITFPFCVELNLDKVVMPIDFERDDESEPSIGMFHNSTIGEVVIPEGTEHLPESVFRLSTIVNKLIVPDSLKEIGAYAFLDAVAEDIEIDEKNIETIGAYAFAGAKGLKSFTFTPSLKSIGEYAFLSCSDLQIVNFDVDCKITELPNNTFEQCEGLTDIVLPGCIKSLGQNCFSNCTNLSSITFNEGIQTIGIGTFADCGNVSTIVLPHSIRTINDAAFQSCDNLTLIDLTAIKADSILSLPYVSPYSFPDGAQLKVANNKMKEIFEAAPGWSSYEGRYIVA